MRAFFSVGGHFLQTPEGYFFQVTAFLAATATSALNRLLATMSQKPCLPVPLRRKREDGSTIDFSDIESMDAME